MGLFKSAFGVVFVVTSPCAIAAAWSDPNPPTIYSDTGAWPIVRQWTQEETRHYAAWMERIYEKKTLGTVEQRQAKLERVLTDPEMNLLEDAAFLGADANPQLPLHLIRAMNNVMDCGKFTAFMPAYYAYRRGLPWMTAIVRTGGGDIRTSLYNVPVGSVNVFTESSVDAFFQKAVGSFISGNYRINLKGKGAEFSDTVPVALNREYLLPGCINYLDGHCLLLASVSEYGELRFLNCSTTPTRDIFSYNGMNTVSGIPPLGREEETATDGCFQGLRVPRYPIAVTDSTGRVIEVRRRTNDEMREFGFSLEQYEAMREMHDTQHIELEDVVVTRYLDFVRLRMKSVDFVSPLSFMEDFADELLEAYVTREDFVQGAWKDVQSNGWITFPEDLANENIFQASGRWESWSSPSSDVDRRNKYFYLGDWLDFAIRMYTLKPGFIDTSGLEKYEIKNESDLAEALLEEKRRIFREHSLSYRNSIGTSIRLTLKDIEERLYDLSFDPNHPPELRWGAPPGSSERSTAPATWTPVPGGARVAMEEAYTLQAFYRTVGQRETYGSSLRGMITSGYPIRSKVDEQLGRWIDGPETWVSADSHEPVVENEENRTTEDATTLPPRIATREPLSLSQLPRPAAQTVDQVRRAASSRRR